MKISHLIFTAIFFLFLSCHENEKITPTNLSTEPPAPDSIQSHIDSLKKICRPGDLIVRLGDDLVSDRIRYLSANDYSYSHAGIIVTHNNEKMVCHIYPNDIAPGADTIRFDNIDTFLNRRTNLKCALYRYDLSDEEKLNFENELNTYHNNKVHFDKKYELKTDDKLYCSEMIYKALKKVTNNRVIIERSNIPKKMQRMVSVYFKNDNYSDKTISARKIIAIDKLYDNTHCHLVMKFVLKAMP